MNENEKKFYRILSGVFAGTSIAGKGGFAKLLRKKAEYYKQIEAHIREDVEKALEEHPGFRTDLYGKLCSFFERYFTTEGSIHFDSTAVHNGVYEQVYESGEDVALFWKTQMLYYTKTDMVYRDMEIWVDEHRFIFSCDGLKGKNTNEKNNLIFKFKEINKELDIVLEVERGKNGSKTNEDEILKDIKKTSLGRTVGTIPPSALERAIKLFKRQSEIDYFINKNAEKFLKEQFKLWLHDYLWEGGKEWNATRVNELQLLKDIAFKIIEFIAKFENELKHLWEKPKFVRNSNYVISMDRLSAALVKKVKAARGYKEQQKEWQELGIKADSPKAPVDTKYFKELELEILAQHNNLDEALDGWLIKSENYQALNTILQKFKGKVQCIYIDPPFNTGEDFSYMDKFQDSTWCTLMANRITLARNFLSDEGSIYVHLDQRMNYITKLLLDGIFGENRFINEIVWNYKGTSNSDRMFAKKHDNIFLYSKSGNYVFNDDDVRLPFNDDNGYKKDEEGKIYKYWSKENPRYYPPQKKVNGEYVLLGKRCYDVFNDIPSASTSHGHEYRFKYNTQKPEFLLNRLIKASSKERGIVMDFFAGSSTSVAVAHKHGRQWIAVEMQENGINVATKRMKQVLAYDEHGISEGLPNYKGGGFFKYYTLEQYEESLDKAIYGEGDLLQQDDESIYKQDVFLADEKMLDCLILDKKNNKVSIDLSKLYDDIDIAETLSNLQGKWIKKISADKVTFADGTNVNIKDLNPQDIKDLIWWKE